MEDTTAGGRGSHLRQRPRQAPKRREGGQPGGPPGNDGGNYGNQIAVSSNGYNGGNDTHDGGDFSRGKGGTGKGSARGKGDSGRGFPHRVQKGGGRVKEDARRAARVRQMDNDDNWRARDTDEAHANLDALSHKKHGAATFPNAVTSSPTAGQQTRPAQQQPQPQPAVSGAFQEESVEPRVNSTTNSPYGAAGPHTQQATQQQVPTMTLQAIQQQVPPMTQQAIQQQVPQMTQQAIQQQVPQFSQQAIQQQAMPMVPTMPMQPNMMVIPVPVTMMAVPTMTTTGQPMMPQAMTQMMQQTGPQMTAVPQVPQPMTPVPQPMSPAQQTGQQMSAVPQPMTQVAQQMTPVPQPTTPVAQPTTPVRNSLPVKASTKAGRLTNAKIAKVPQATVTPAPPAVSEAAKSEAMDEWLNFLSSQRNEAEGEVVGGRGIAPGRGRGRGRLMNQRLERGRGRGSIVSGGAGTEGNATESPTALVESGGDDIEVSSPPPVEPDPPSVSSTTTSPTPAVAKATGNEPMPAVSTPPSTATATATGRGSTRATGRRGGRGLGRGTSSGTPNVEDTGTTESSKCTESAPSSVPVGPAPVLSPGPKAWGPPPSNAVPAHSTKEPEDTLVQNSKLSPPAHQHSSPKLSPRSSTSTAPPEVPGSTALEVQTTATQATQEKEEEETTKATSSTSPLPTTAVSSTATASTQERRKQQVTADEESPPGSPTGTRVGGLGQAPPTPATSSNSPAPITEENPPCSPPPSAPSSAGVRLDEVPRENGTAPPAPKDSFGGWERAFRRDDELLRSCNLWCKKVEADGACLFRAFSDQLEGDAGSNHLKYRGICVTYLEAHRADYAPFVEGNFKGYCARLREPAEWAGEIEAQALCRALGINALIHRPDLANTADNVPSAAVEVTNFAEDAQCVQLCFHPRYHSGPHYNSVRCAGDKGESLPLRSTLTEVKERMSEALQLRRQRLKQSEAG